MIHGIKIINGFATELPHFHPNKIITFTDKLNILFGPNGSGKSTILKMLKAYCAIPAETGGWSRINDPLALGAQSRQHFPWVYREFSPGHCDCAVLWDGTPTFMNEGDVKIDKWAWFTHKDIASADGISSEQDHMDALIDNRSSGQYRINILNKILNVLENPPNLLEFKSKQPGGIHPAEQAELEYFRSLPRNGKITLLLDEPERALSLPKQLELFGLLGQLSDKYQIIIATHSPFALFNPDANIINVEPNYDKECLRIIKECANSGE